MGIARTLEEIDQGLTQLTEQGKIVGFLANTEVAQRINGFVDDIREVMMDYQVCASGDSFLPCLMNVLDFIATRYL